MIFMRVHAREMVFVLTRFNRSIRTLHSVFFHLVYLILIEDQSIWNIHVRTQIYTPVTVKSTSLIFDVEYTAVRTSRYLDST